MTYGPKGEGMTGLDDTGSSSFFNKMLEDAMARLDEHGRAVIDHRAAVEQGARAGLASGLGNERPLPPLSFEAQNDRHSVQRLRPSRSSRRSLPPRFQITLSDSGVLQAVDEQLAERLNRSPKRLLNRSFADLVAAEDRPSFWGHIGRVLSTASRHSCVIRLLDSTGEGLPFHLESIAVPGDEADPRGSQILITGYAKAQRPRPTLRSTAAQSASGRETASLTRVHWPNGDDRPTAALPRGARANSEVLVPSIIGSSAEATIKIDCDGLIESFSKAAEGLFGREASEVIGRSFECLIAPEDRASWSQRFRRRLGNDTTAMTEGAPAYQGLRKDGSSFGMEIVLGELNANERRRFVAFVQKSIHDGRATFSAADELRGELFSALASGFRSAPASALAHEIVQPLTAIMNYLKACRRLMEKGEGHAADSALTLMDKAVGEARRAGQVVHRLRRLVEKGEFERAPADIGEILKESAELALASALDQSIDFDLDVEPGLPQVLVDRVQIQQVVLNLIRNAVEALESAGERELSIRASRDGLGGIEVAVSDTGCGLSPQAAKRLFSPIVSEKASGMGVGLAICRLIVVAHGGRIWAADRSGGGAQFSFSLPIAQKGERNGTARGQYIHSR